MMTNITLKTLQETREQLNASYEQLKQLKGECINGDSDMLARLELQMEQITALKEKFIEQREALSTVLPDGTKLWPGQFESLERFASNNGLGINLVLSKITVEGGVVTECDFEGMGLTTLSGLEGLVRLRKLNVHGNSELTSLKGIPTQAIEKISAAWCSLTGDLSELSGADKLKVLRVANNQELTSLKGIPTQAIELISAWRCGLTGDLSELSGADKLKKLSVGGNQGLTSLKGIPTQAIEEIYAYECGLTGDHTFLSKAPHLEVLHVRQNPALTLDKTKFNSAVDIYL